ncbi:MAG: DUF1428 domain-containing protein [Gammaproteobacteria bacterium]
MAYIDGFVLAVPAERKEAYRNMALEALVHFKEYGALRLVEAWGDEVPDGTVTDFKSAVKAQPSEVVVFSWIEWSSKEVREQAWQKAMSDPRMRDQPMPFDGRRTIYGGFAPLVDQ